MKIFTSLVAFTFLVTLFSGPALGQEKKQKKNRGRSQASLFYSQVQQAVPGINGLIQLKSDQRQKIEDLRKKIFESEKVLAAQKTFGDIDASPQDRKAARGVVEAAQTSLVSKLADIIGQEQVDLINKINASVVEVQGEIRTEYRQKIRDSKDNEEERKKVQQEIAKKRGTLLLARVESLLSDKQKSALKKSAERGKSESEKRTKRKKKKEEGTD